MQGHEKLFEEFLKTKGLKLTKPRKIILEAVYDNHNHFNVDALYDQIKEKYDNVSRATVYRTMPLLVESGLINQSLRCQSKDHYEHVHGHPDHLHLICVKCGKILEAESINAEKLLRKIADKQHFLIKDFNLGAKGYCADCR